MDSESMHFPCYFLPCALVISVPLGFFGGIGAASKIGVLVKGSNYLEAVAEMTTIVFDKTGTLTKGEFKVTDVITENGSKEELIELAALGEGYSNHPIANSIREATERAGFKPCDKHRGNRRTRNQSCDRRKNRITRK